MNTALMQSFQVYTLNHKMPKKETNANEYAEQLQHT